MSQSVERGPPDSCIVHAKPIRTRWCRECGIVTEIWQLEKSAAPGGWDVLGSLIFDRG